MGTRRANATMACAASSATPKSIVRCPAGFAGIENELFYNEKTFMLFGDAKKSLTALASEVKEL